MRQTATESCFSKPPVLGYVCSLCGAEYGANFQGYTCPKDQGNLTVQLDFARLRTTLKPEAILASRENSLWRYEPLLPVSDPGYHDTPLHSAGFTPTFRLTTKEKELGLSGLYVKDEGRNSTASFKDRASTVLIARAKEIGAQTIVTASTGNAGAALAGMAAATDHHAVIFAPKTAPPAKISQLLVFHSDVILVDGNYDDAFDLSVLAAEKYGWYCRNTGYNAYTAEGKKTGAYEIWEQLIVGRNIAPENLCVFVSVGDGNIISGIHKGFKDLVELGWIERSPRIYGIQSQQSPAIYNAWIAGTETITPVKATTIADSISVDLPRDGVRALRAATETGGKYLAIPDETIYEGIRQLGAAGIFAEPAGATAYVGMLEAVQRGEIGPNDVAIVVSTGSGMKDIRSAMKATGEAVIIEPTLTALERYLEKRQ